MSTAAKELDPYTAKAQNDNLTPQQKIDGLHAIVKSVKTGMLTSRDAAGQLHARAMAPAGPFAPTQTSLVFLANKASAKFDELENDPHVNVSFYDEATTNWASYAGTARIINDRDVIKKHWSSMTSAWFSDLGDGVHKGDHDDPRVAAIEVVPDEIRYWMVTKGPALRTLDIAASALSGGTATPGELRTITKEEILLTQGIQVK